MKLLPHLATALLLTVHAMQAQTVILWNNTPPPRGVVFREETSIRLDGGKFFLDIKDQTLGGSANALIRDTVDRTWVTTDTQKVEVITSSRNISFSLGGNTQPKEEAGKLTGKKLTGKKVNHHWTFALADRAKPEPAEETALKQFAGYTDGIEALGLLYGNKPRKVGETWKPDLGDLKKTGPDIDADLECKLDSIGTEGGDRVAHISVTGHLFANLGNQGKLQLAVNAVITRSLRDMIDTDIQINGNFKFDGAFGKGDSNAEITAPLKFSRTLKAAKR